MGDPFGERASSASTLMDSAISQVTRLVQRWVEGDREALDQILPIVYDRLRQLAHQRLRRGGGGGSLNTSELVHEVYLKLVDAPSVSLRDRSHFLALASQVMRNLLVDHARARQAQKRGGPQRIIELQEDMWVSEETADLVADLDEALRRLEILNARQSRILEHRYFGGLSLEETAEALGVSLATVKRELRSARAWLTIELQHDSR